VSNYVSHQVEIEETDI